MKLTFSRTITIKELKHQFSRNFPFLRLAFYQNEADATNGSAAQQGIGDEVCLCELKTLKKEGFFQLDATAIVAAFEQKIKEEFGLLVQIYRKAGVMWIQTTETGNQSLDMQNKMGEVAGRPMTVNLNSLFL